MSQQQRSIRLSGRSALQLTKTGGSDGEIFYDTTNQTLWVYSKTAKTVLATQPYVTAAVNTAIENIPTTDLTGYATENYVDTAIENIPSTDLTGLATETYVDTAISNIPTTDLTGYATENYVDTAISDLIATAPSTLNTLNELAAALNDDASFSTTITTAIGLKAPIDSPTFTGTVSGITATHVGLGNVTNESKVTMFTNPTFTYNGTNAIINLNSEGLDVVRGGITLDDSNGSGATRISFRDNSGQLGYIDTIGEYNTYPNNTSGIGFYTGIGNLGLSITENKGIQFHRAVIESCELDGGTSGVVEYDFQGSSGVYYIIEPAGNITANFTNMPVGNPPFSTPGAYSFTAAFVIEQGATPYITNALQIGGLAQTILWQGGSTPTGTANSVDIVSFTLIYVPLGPTSSWTVLGSISNYR